MLGAVAEFDKAMTVAKLRGARERRRREVGKCEGRKSHAGERPEVVAEAKRLARASPKTGERWSLRKIAKELAALGHLNVNGRPYSAKSVRSMIRGCKAMTRKALGRAAWVVLLLVGAAYLVAAQTFFPDRYQCYPVTSWLRQQGWLQQDHRQAPQVPQCRFFQLGDTRAGPAAC